MSKCVSCNREVPKEFERLVGNVLYCPSCEAGIPKPQRQRIEVEAEKVRSETLRVEKEAAKRITRAAEIAREEARQKRDKPSAILHGDYFICPHCGYEGVPLKKEKASTAVGCLLCLFFLIPGILYFIICSGHTRWCPKCGMQVGNV